MLDSRVRALAPKCTIIALCVLVEIIGNCSQVRSESLVIPMNNLSDPVIEFRPISGTGPGFAKATKDGLQIKLHKQDTTEPGCKYSIGVKGDFEAKLSLEDLKIEQPTDGWGQGILFTVYLGGAEGTALQLSVIASTKTKSYIRAEKLNHPDDEKYSNLIFTSGELVIERKGSTANFRVRQGSEDTLIYSTKCPRDDFQAASFICTRQAKGNTGFQVLVKQFELTADGFATFHSAESNMFRIWSIASVVFFVISLSAMFWLKRGSA